MGYILIQILHIKLYVHPAAFLTNALYIIAFVLTKEVGKI